MSLFITFLILISILFIPIPLKIKIEYLNQNLNLKLFNHIIFSSQNGIESNLLKKFIKKQKYNTKKNNINKKTI